VCPTESDCSLFTDAISRAADVDWFEGLGFDCFAITNLTHFAHIYKGNGAKLFPEPMMPTDQDRRFFPLPRGT
jgi:hypothetical protein